MTLEELTRLRHQLVAFQMHAEELRLAIQNYAPEEHAPECIAQGGEGIILMGRSLASGERVAIKVERRATHGALPHRAPSTRCTDC